MKYLFLKLDKHDLFSIVLILLLFFTTNHYSYEDALLLNQLDSKSYYHISKYSPDLIFNKEIPFHHYQRFLLPYFIGLISKILSLEIFTVYKSTVVIFLFLISIIHKKIFLKLGHNFKTSIVMLSIIIFSPYLSRYILSIPMMLVDLGFVLICYLAILSYISNNKWLDFLIPFSLIFRISGIALLISHLMILSFNFKKNFRRIAFLIINSILVITILDYLSKNLTGREFSNLHYLGLFSELEINNFYNIFIFIAKPIFCFIPLIFLLLFSKIELNKINFKNFIFLFFVAIMLIGQPILGGLQITGNNIFRLASLSLPFLIFFLTSFTNIKKIISEHYIIIIFINFLYSLHPKYSLIFSFTN